MYFGIFSYIEQEMLFSFRACCDLLSFGKVCVVFTQCNTEMFLIIIIKIVKLLTRGLSVFDICTTVKINVQYKWNQTYCFAFRICCNELALNRDVCLQLHPSFLGIVPARSPVPSPSSLAVFPKINTASPQLTVISFPALVLTLQLVETISAPHWGTLPVVSQAAFPSSVLVLDQRVRHVWVSRSWQVYLGSVYCAGSSHFPSSLPPLQLLCILPWHPRHTHTHTRISVYRRG